MVFGVWPLTRMRVSESSSSMSRLKRNIAAERKSALHTTATHDTTQGERRARPGRVQVDPLLIGFPRERGPQKMQLIPLAPRGSSSDRQQPVGCLDPHRMSTHMGGGG
jgi:hypothetical protein